jgi:hypothetical protein
MISDHLQNNHTLSVSADSEVFLQDSDYHVQPQNVFPPAARLRCSTPPDASSKPLRPLGSFFDSFRERGRSATMEAAENPPDPNLASNYRNTTPVSAGNIHGSLRSFVRASPRNGPSITPRQLGLPTFLNLKPSDTSTPQPLIPGRKRRPMERIAPNDTRPSRMLAPQNINPDDLKTVLGRNNGSTAADNLEELATVTEDNIEPHTQYLSSAKILSVLRPQPYQIMLFSPSSSLVISRPQTSIAFHAPADVALATHSPSPPLILGNIDLFDGFDF